MYFIFVLLVFEPLQPPAAAHLGSYVFLQVCHGDLARLMKGTRTEDQGPESDVCGSWHFYGAPVGCFNSMNWVCRPPSLYTPCWHQAAAHSAVMQPSVGSLEGRVQGGGKAQTCWPISR